jgi:hypothetical protein
MMVGALSSMSQSSQLRGSSALDSGRGPRPRDPTSVRSLSQKRPRVTVTTRRALIPSNMVMDHVLSGPSPDINENQTTLPLVNTLPTNPREPRSTGRTLSDSLQEAVQRENPAAHEQMGFLSAVFEAREKVDAAHAEIQDIYGGLETTLHETVCQMHEMEKSQDVLALGAKIKSQDNTIKVLQIDNDALRSENKTIGIQLTALQRLSRSATQSDAMERSQAPRHKMQVKLARHLMPVTCERFLAGNCLSKHCKYAHPS